jgi:sensor c-di-GMP phosphodiesterase-like protein
MTISALFEFIYIFWRLYYEIKCSNNRSRNRNKSNSNENSILIAITPAAAAAAAVSSSSSSSSLSSSFQQEQIIRIGKTIVCIASAYFLWLVVCII